MVSVRVHRIARQLIFFGSQIILFSPEVVLPLVVQVDYHWVQVLFIGSRNATSSCKVNKAGYSGRVSGEISSSGEGAHPSRD